MKKIIMSLFLFINIVHAEYIRDSSKEIVIDTTTNLMWHDSPDVKIIKKTWLESIAYCESSNLGTYSDWRLPNFNELYMLIDTESNNPSLNSNFNNVGTYYWSSTTYASDTNLAWTIDFINGSDSSSAKTDLIFIRCVR